jgi:Vitamin B12 dependent methionine synthase, activation domain
VRTALHPYRFCFTTNHAFPEARFFQKLTFAVVKNTGQIIQTFLFKYSTELERCREAIDLAFAGVRKSLKPGEIGMHLTKDLKKLPEANLSALVLHHQECRYFSVGENS